MKRDLTLAERVQAAATILSGYGIEHLTGTNDDALAEWGMNLVDALESQARRRLDAAERMLKEK